ncbi:MAG: hypothetical protein ACFFG0_40735 [Candidatus Thorarchaeota archaeon]
MSDKLHITEKLLVSLQETNSWKGSGTESDPIVIDSINKSRLKFKKISRYILIKDITVWEMYFIKCKNIAIDNCKIGTLTFEECNYISVENCRIINGELTYSRECKFRNNQLDKRWASNTLTVEGVKESEGGMVYVQRIFAPMFIIFIIISILCFSFSKLSIGFMLLFASLIPLLIVINIRMRRRHIKNLGPNIFENNKAAVFEDKAFDYKEYAKYH